MINVLSDRACEEQFSLATELVNSFVHAAHIEDYYFDAVSGAGVLSVIPEEIAHPTILDIGAGYGTFLREVRRISDREMRTVGLVAVDGRRSDDERIEWVFGDFQRPETWTPGGTLELETVDLAVASLVFQHFADPLRALGNAIDLLKPGGSLFVDTIKVPHRQGEATLVQDTLEQSLGANAGRFGYSLHCEDDGIESLVVTGLHYQKKIEPSLDRFQLELNDDVPGLIYTLSPGPVSPS